MESVASSLFNPLRDFGRSSQFPALRPILPLPHAARHRLEHAATHSLPSPPDTPPKPFVFASTAAPEAFNITSWSPALESRQGATKRQKRRRRSLPCSYSVMITQAILSSSTHKMTLRDIYLWISTRYPDLYADNETGWQNTIRHNLSLNRIFKKVPRQESGLPGKGGYWTIDFQYFDYETFRQKASVESSIGSERSITGAYTTRPPTQRALLGEIQFSSSAVPSDSCYTSSMTSSPHSSDNDYFSSPSQNMDQQSNSIDADRDYDSDSRSIPMRIQNILN